MALRNWNPREPYALGLEWPGMRTMAVPLSQDVEYGHTFQANATETIDSASFEIVGPSGSGISRNTSLVTVYRRDNNNVDETGDELDYGTVVSQLVPVNGGTLNGAAALAGGASITACLVTQSDQNFIDIPNAADSVDLEFATAGLFTGKRILEVKVHYYATNFSRFVNGTTYLASTMALRAAGANLVTIVAPIADAINADPWTVFPVVELSCGEVYYDTATLPKCWPWTVGNVQGFDAATTVIRFNGSAAFDIALGYVVLEVVWCEENRTAIGGLLLGAASAAGEESMAPGRHLALLRTPTGVDNWAKIADAYYAVTVTAARSPSDSDRSVRADTPLVPLVDAFEMFTGHQGRVAPRLPTNVLGALGADTRLCPIKFLTTGATIPTDFDPYDRAFGAQVFNGTYAAQDIEQRSGGTVDYPWIRFYARIVGDPVDVPAIDITTTDGTMNYFATSLLLLDEIFDGWREVTVAWPAGQEPTIINDSSNKNVQFSTTQGTVAHRWEILAVDSYSMLIDAPTDGNPTYGQGNSQAAYAPYGIGAEAGDPYADLVVTLHTAAPAVAGYSTDLLTVALAYEDSCVDACQVPSLKIVRVNFTASSLAAADFGYYEIQRKDTYDATWRTVAKLVNVATTSWADNEMRRGGVTSDYRMRIVRADRIEGAWTATSSEVVTDDADTPAGTMYFTSNSGNTAIAYGALFDGVPEEGFTFVEAGDVVTQRMYGRFGTQAFHPTERGGIAFERTLLVNQVAATPNALLQTAWDALRDLAWADVPYVCVTDEIGNRWFGTLIVPDGVFVRAPGIHMASIRFIESTQEPFPDSGV